MGVSSPSISTSSSPGSRRLVPVSASCSAKTSLTPVSYTHLGAGTLNTTVMCPDIIENSVNLLKKINWRGAAEIDFIQNERDNTAKVMEINPRVSGSVKIVFEAGVNLARQMLELVYDTPVTEYKRYRIGQRLRCSQIDLLWFIKSNNRFKANPS